MTVTTRPSPPVLEHLGPQHRVADFDRVARVYRWAEYLCLGPLLERTRLHFLPQLTQTESALVLGDGDGRFTAALLRCVPIVRVLAVDSSSRMLALLRHRCSFASGRLSTLQLNLEKVDDRAALGCPDLIVTHFVLDCLPQETVERLALHLASRARPGCRWVLSEFALPHGKLWRLLGAFYIRALYLAFGMLTGLRVRTLPDFAQALTRAGFQRLEHRTRLGGLLLSEVWHLPPDRG